MLPRWRIGIVLCVTAATLSGCAGPLALIPVTPLLSATLASRSEDSRMAQAVSEAQKKGDWAEIEKIAQAKLVRAPENADAYIMLGYSLLEQKRYSAAIQALSVAVKIDPEEIDGWNLLADAQRRNGQPGAASRTAERAATIDPSSPIARYLLGEAHRENGNAARAQEAYREAIRLVPNYAPAWNGLGLTLLEFGSRAELDEVATRLQALDPAAAQEFTKARATFKR